MTAIHRLIEFRQQQMAQQLQPHMSFVRDVMSSVTVDHVPNLEPVSEGVTNIVFRSDRSLIVRVHIGSEPWFERERLALDLAGTNAIPAPRMQVLEHLRIGDGFVSVCVENALPGEPLRKRIDENRIGIDNRRRIVAEAGCLLRRIHAIDASELPNLGGHGHFTATDVREFDVETGTLKVLPAAYSEALQAISVAHSPSRPNLVHGDFDTKHILVDGPPGGEVLSGILDWEEARPGDPLFDYRRRAFWQVLPSVESLLDGRGSLADTYGSDAEARFGIAVLDAARGAVDWEVRYLGGVERGTLDLIVEAGRCYG